MTKLLQAPPPKVVGFNINPEVSDLNKELKRKERSTDQEKDKKVLPFLISGIVVPMAGLCFISLDQAPENTTFLVALGVVVSIWAAYWSIRTFRLNATSETVMVNEDKKNKRRSMKQSVRAARVLGDVVPVLTKDHVEAGFRFDSMMLAYEPMTSQDEGDTRTAAKRPKP